MAIYHIKVPVSKLLRGMYVSNLDRPWVETPFPIQGFFIENPDQINDLSKYCKYVIIDIFRGIRPKSEEELLAAAESRAASGNSQSGAIKTKPLKVNHNAYHQVTSLKKEISRVDNLRKQLSDSVGDFYMNLRKKEPASLTDIMLVIHRITGSIIRNPDALIWLNRLENENNTLYSQSLRTAIWAIVFARHLGISQDAMNNLALGIVLSDIGKLKLPAELVNKQGRHTPRELDHLQKHVALGIELVQKIQGLDPQVISVVAAKNERHNGCGYPAGLTGDKIPYLAKIAGIADYYDKLTQGAEGRDPVTPGEAVNSIFASRNTLFQEDLVDEFIQAIGIYPPGTLVELNSKEVGIILSQDRDRRLYPEIMLLLDADKKPVKRNRKINLQKFNKSDKKELSIEKALVDGSYGIYIKDIYDKAFARTWGMKLAS